MLSRYMKVANVYIENFENEESMIEKINQTLSKETENINNIKIRYR